MPPPHRFVPIIKSANFGYVVENFLGPNVYTGEETEYITKGGKPCIFPDLESVPPKWRQYAKPATQLEAAIGYIMPRVVTRVKETDLT